METRKLGSQGLVVSAMGLGCMGMSDFYAGRDDAESIRTLHVALDRGSAVVGLLSTLAFGWMRWRDEHAPAQTAVSADEGAEYPYSLVAQVRANTADVAEIAGRVDALNRALGAALEYAEIQGPVSRPSRWRHLRPLRDATGPQPRVLCTASACGLSA